MAGSNSADDYARVYNTLITPFKNGGHEIDHEAMRELVDYHVTHDLVEAAGGGVVVNPEAGEIFYLTREERKRNVETVVNEVDGKCPVFAGVFGVRVEECIETAKDALDAGADGLFILPPAGTIEVSGTMDAVNYPEIWVDHVKRIDEVADVPLIIHPTAPSQKYGGGLPLEPTLELLTEVPNVVGWKMIYDSRTFKKVATAIEAHENDVAVLGARAPYFHEAMSLDLIDGMTTGSLNYSMEPTLEHYRAWQNDDIDGARDVWRDLAPLHDYVYDRSRLHIRYKIAAWLRGFTPHPDMRPPVPQARKAEIESLNDLLQNLGLETISQNAVDEGIERYAR